MQSAKTKRKEIVEMAQRLVATFEKSEECEEKKKPNLGIKGEGEPSVKYSSSGP